MKTDYAAVSPFAYDMHAQEAGSPPAPRALPGAAPAIPEKSPDDSHPRIRPCGTKQFLALFNNKASGLPNDAELAKAFGNSVTVYSSRSKEVRHPHNPARLPEPSKDSMALLYKFCGTPSLKMISSVKSPHLLEYLPGQIVNVQHSVALDPSAPSTSAFLLNTTLDELKESAARFPANSRVVIAGNDSRSVAQQVAFLSHARADLQVIGHASTFHDPDNTRGAIDAFRRVGTMLRGETAVVTAALKTRDSAWIGRKTGCRVPAGTAITAPFDARGRLDRNAFAAFLRAERADANQSLMGAVNAFDEINLPTISAGAIAPQMHTSRLRRKKPVDAHHADAGIKSLGKVMVFGSTGNVGSALVEVMSGRTTVYAMKRNIAKTPVDSLGNAAHPVFELGDREIPEGMVPDTVFLAASAPRPTDEHGRIIVDRAAMLETNLEQVLIPAISKLPAGIRLVQVITNPCSDMAFAAWLLRPDLAEKISGHSGTDMVRQQQHVARPGDPGSYFTFGPHSPGQVNVDIERNAIDPDIAVKGDDIARRSGGQPATDPTALSSVLEAINITNHVRSSYALPLTALEAAELTSFLAEVTPRGQDLQAVSEGVAITVPRNSDGAIDWDMLRKASDNLPEFAGKANAAVAEVEGGRRSVLDKLVRMVDAKHPELRAHLNHDWILANRERLLSLVS
ncbi:MAG TPA: hypothetical protein VGU61_14655 [Noviherbaspirillum sp.]|jgi:hypothetical protein|uniref:hypothetical protein n=1 Tax=Noviherbaspirillum sp. TaxID=1926288 RepID=UPI002DDD7CCB|nr:hypothetical protein [Noviherbaspirillum sp.]HEV2611507.1 hypothetical protein [Noviherbaspirillum sp.]